MSPSVDCPIPAVAFALRLAGVAVPGMEEATANLMAAVNTSRFVAELQAGGGLAVWIFELGRSPALCPLRLGR